VRAPITIVLFIACCASASCFAQESKRLWDITHPDLTMPYSDQKKKFEGGGNVKIRPYDAGVSSFAIKSAYTTSAFQETHSFWGIKNPWLGTKVYDTRTADFSNNMIIKNADRQFPVKSKDVKTFADSGKTAEDKPAYYTKPFVPPKPPTQSTFDEISAKLDKKLTIDDVRELLNKTPKNN
jgi:hypothetical protein